MLIWLRAAMAILGLAEFWNAVVFSLHG
jgi:hypothetical protein